MGVARGRASAPVLRPPRPAPTDGIPERRRPNLPANGHERALFVAEACLAVLDQGLERAGWANRKIADIGCMEHGKLVRPRRLQQLLHKLQDAIEVFRGNAWVRPLFLLQIDQQQGCARA